MRNLRQKRAFLVSSALLKTLPGGDLQSEQRSPENRESQQTDTSGERRRQAIVLSCGDDRMELTDDAKNHNTPAYFIRPQLSHWRRYMAVKPDPAIALWVADVVQVQTLSSLNSPTAEHLKLIKDSADRLWQILNGQLTPEAAAKMKTVAERMAAEVV